MIITQGENNCQNGMRQKMIEVDCIRERLLGWAEDRCDAAGISRRLLGSGEDCRDPSGISRRSTRIAVISPGSDEDRRN